LLVLTSTNNNSVIRTRGRSKAPVSVPRTELESCFTQLPCNVLNEQSVMKVKKLSSSVLFALLSEAAAWMLVDAYKSFANKLSHSRMRSCKCRCDCHGHGHVFVIRLSAAEESRTVMAPDDVQCEYILLGSGSQRFNMYLSTSCT